MEIPPSSGRSMSETESRILGGAGWPSLLDRILGRLSHDLNGRTMALDAMFGFVEAGRDPPSGLRDEVERLWEISQLLSILPAQAQMPPQAALVREALQPALRLYTHLLRSSESPVGADISGDPPPIRVGEARFTRAILLYLDALGAGPSQPPVLHVRGDPDHVEIRAAVGPNASEGSSLTSLGELFAIDAGTLESGSGELVVRFPSLSARGSD